MDDVSRPEPQHEALLRRLEDLVHKHLLYFRIEVGRAVVDELFGGDLEAWRDKSGHKPTSVHRFASDHAERLETLGLDEAGLRKSIQAWSVVARLETSLATRLEFSHAVVLASVEDAQTRDHLAKATVDNGWSVRALKRAVGAVAEGRWIDGDPATPGLQPPAEVAPEPPAPPPEPKVPLSGHVVNRVERSAADFAAQLDAWETLPVERLTQVQRARLREALDLVEERARRLRARVG